MCGESLYFPFPISNCVSFIFLEATICDREHISVENSRSRQLHAQRWSSQIKILPIILLKDCEVVHGQFSPHFIKHDNENREQHEEEQCAY